jgi:hypothetical protein
LKIQANDLYINPKPGGMAIIDGPLKVIGGLTSQDPIDPNDFITVTGPRGDQGEVGPIGPQGPYGRYNLDGGHAGSIYLPSQNIDGGGA